MLRREDSIPDHLRDRFALDALDRHPDDHEVRVRVHPPLTGREVRRGFERDVDELARPETSLRILRKRIPDHVRVRVVKDAARVLEQLPDRHRGDGQRSLRKGGIETRVEGDLPLVHQLQRGDSDIRLRDAPDTRSSTSSTVTR